MTRAFWVWLHRWCGLTTAAFLIVVGLTGALLAFLDELNHWLTPNLYPGPHAGVELDMATLARRAERLAPQARANQVFVGHVGTARVAMEARPGAPPLDFSYICLDAVTGEELGRLRWDALPTRLDRVMPFVYALHETLLMGNVGGWILGIVALVWTVDCFVSFYLTLPRIHGSTARNLFSRWKPAWLVKFRSSVYRVNFDLHRAGGLWLWALLLCFAWSSVCFNLNGFYTSTIRLLVDYDQPVWAQSSSMGLPKDREPLSWDDAKIIAEKHMKEQAMTHGFAIERPLAFYIHRDKALYEYRVRSSRDIGDKAGHTAVFFDALSGELQSVSLPIGQHAGNTLTTWLVELHMANLFGLPYKIFVSVLGLVITMLSVTGVYIWWKKRRARLLHAARAPALSYPAK